MRGGILHCCGASVRTTLDKESSRSTKLTLEPDDAGHLARLCGQFDRNIHQIETRLGVAIHNRGNVFHLHGPADTVDAAQKVLYELFCDVKAGKELNPDELHLQLQKCGLENSQDAEEGTPEAGQDAIRVHKRTIEPRSPNQHLYVRSIREHDLCFGLGPAGTGKSYLAVACAVEAMERQRVQRIILTRPAVEAGERLGFLPGDMNQKIDPYLQPLYDALHRLLGRERVDKAISQGAIEIAPLAYMRGRTLHNAFVILDEAQNTTEAQIKMFLTRLGFDSVAVVNGDPSQVDLAPNLRSGLITAVERLQKIPGIAFVHFDGRDVIRHPLVRRIVDAWKRNPQAKKSASAKTPRRARA